MFKNIYILLSTGSVYRLRIYFQIKKRHNKYYNTYEKLFRPYGGLICKIPHIMLVDGTKKVLLMVL